MPGASLAARYVTGSGNVGGDWYDVFPLPDGKPGIGRVAATLGELTADATRPR